MGYKLQNIPKEKITLIDKIDSLLKKEISIFPSKTWTNKRKEEFYMEIALLLKAGIPLKETLQVLYEEQNKGKLKSSIKLIQLQFESGVSFSEVLERSNGFSSYEYQTISLGERTGNLDQVLTDLYEYYKSLNEQRKLIMSSLSYPIIVLLTALFAIAFMLKFVVPMFATTFKQNGMELPFITEVVVHASLIFSNYFWWIIVFLILLIISLTQLYKVQKFNKFVDQTIQYIPLLGSYKKTLELSKFTRVMYMLINAQVPVLESIQISITMMSFFPLKNSLAKIETNLVKGISVSQSIKDDPFFDSKFKSLVKVAEESNNYDFIFQNLSEQYNDNVKNRSKVLGSVMEPLLIVFLGIVVGTILISMYLPMFEMSSGMG